MRKINFYIFFFCLVFSSCKTEYKLIGEWEEIQSKKEIIIFLDNGEMIIDDVLSPIRFKFNVTKIDSNLVYFQVKTYRDSILLDSVNNLAVFHTKDSMTLQNTDFNFVRQTSYKRKK